MSTTKFYTVQEFKSLVSLPQSVPAQVVKSPQTGKLFVAMGSKNFKCQATINPKLEMRMLVEEDNYEEACLVNVKSSTENILFEL